MRRLLLKLPLLAGLGPGLWRAAGGHSAPLAFVIVTSSTLDDARNRWEPFFAELREATGLDVRGLYSPTYADAIDALVTNRAQLGWLSSKAALDCVDHANVEVFGQLIDANGSPGYRSIIITHRDSPVSSIDQLLAKPRVYGFAIGESASTAGNAIPSYALFVPRGIRPEEHFVPLVRGNHGQTLEAVLAGEVHAGTYNTAELQRLKTTQPARASSVRVLWESTLIPNDPLLWRKDLPLSIRSKLATYLFAYGQTARGKTRLKNIFNLAGFRPSTNQQLRFVLELEDFRQRSEVLLDPRLSNAQKDERLGDLRDRYSRLARALEPASQSRL